MSPAVLTRSARLIVTLLAVTFFSALMVDLLPGDPAVALIAGDTTTGSTTISEAELERVRVRLGLSDPVPVRYANWLSNAVTGDLGQSFRTRQPVASAIVERLPVTLQLLVTAQVLAIGFTLAIAPLAALRRGHWFDRVASGMSFGMLSTPPYVGGLVLIYIFAVQLGVLPATGFEPLGDGFQASVRSLLLPAVALAIPEAAVLTRLLRAEMINTLGEDFILMAKGKGLPVRRILFRHAMRPSSLPLITVAGLNIGALIGGAVIVETLFALPGIGRLAVDSILTRDFLMVQGVVAFVTITYVTINYIVDLTYVSLDPRIRHAST